MEGKSYSSVHDLCIHYQINQSFIIELVEAGVIQVYEVDQIKCVHAEELITLEKVIRIHQDLKVNVEGIDVVLNLLEQIDEHKKQIKELENRLFNLK